MYKILVVDDEKRIRDLVKEYLTFESFECDEAEDGAVALQKLREGDYDLVVLDIMMPRIDGMTVLKELRKEKDTPVIMLSARGEEYDKLFGFELGADDYLIKPFSPKELIARIKIILRRRNNVVVLPERLIIGPLQIDISGRNVYINEQKINLTPKEFELLLFLARNRSVALSRDKILEEVWGYDFFGDDRTVDTHIKMLRNSMGEMRECIKTIWGIGYKFEYEEE